MFRRLSLLTLLVTGCALADPNYEADPDAVLSQLLDGYEAAPEDPRQRRQARAAVEQLATRFPSHRPSLLAAAVLAFEDRSTNTARTFVDALLRLDPGNADALVMRARLAVTDGNLPLARDFVERGIRMHPGHGGLLEISAWLYDLDGDTAAAYRALERAENLGAPSWRVAYNRGLIEEARGNTTAAMQHFTNCIEVRPDYEPAHERLRALAASESRK